MLINARYGIHSSIYYNIKKRKPHDFPLQKGKSAFEVLNEFPYLGKLSLKWSVKRQKEQSGLTEYVKLLLYDKKLLTNTSFCLKDYLNIFKYYKKISSFN